MAAIYEIQRDKESGALSIKTTWESDKTSTPLPSDYSDLYSLEAYGHTLMVGSAPDRKQLDLYRILPDGAGLELKVQQGVEAGYGYLRGFTVAGVPHLLAYDSAAGSLDFYRVTEQLGLEFIYTYRKSYGLVTNGFTTIEAYEYRGDMLILAYNTNDGDVKLYQLQVTSKQPLSISCVRHDSWSPGWVRFTFFKQGEENFFLKSNIKHESVYIDHLADDPSAGSHPVGRHLPLSLDLDLVQSFEFDGCIYFLAYRKTGEAVLNRLHTDCQAWTEVASFTALTEATCAVPFCGEGAAYLFLYGGPNSEQGT